MRSAAICGHGTRARAPFLALVSALALGGACAGPPEAPEVGSTQHAIEGSVDEAAILGLEEASFPAGDPLSPQEVLGEEKLAFPPAASLPKDYKLLFLLVSEDPFDRVILLVTDVNTKQVTARAYLAPEARRRQQELAKDPTKTVVARAVPASASVQVREAWQAITANYGGAAWASERWVIVPIRVFDRSHIDAAIDWLYTLDPGPSYVAVHYLPHAGTKIGVQTRYQMLDSPRLGFYPIEGPTGILAKMGVQFPQGGAGYPVGDLAERLSQYRYSPTSRLNDDAVFVLDACYSATAVDLSDSMHVHMLSSVDVRGARTSRADFTRVFAKFVEPSAYQSFDAKMPSVLASTNAAMAKLLITFNPDVFVPQIPPPSYVQRGTIKGWVDTLPP